ncbi:R8 protein [Elasticomyces elasticus]|nr:R8 protein [Elasticomyces elasticus]
MFYSHEVLTSRKYGVATVWLVATLGSKSTLKKVNRKAIIDVDVPKACETILTPEAPMALRLQSNLLYGVSRVYSQQCSYVLADAQNAQNNMRALLRVMKNQDMVPEAGRVRPDQLILPDDPSFLPDLNLGFDFDLANLELSGTGSSQRSSLLSPHVSSSGLGSEHDPSGLIIPQSVSSFNGGADGFEYGGYNAQSDGARGARMGSGLFARNDEAEILADVDFVFDADGNMIDAPAHPRGASSARTPGPVLGSDTAASALVRREHAEGQQIGTVLGQLDDDGFVPIHDDYDNLPGGEAFPPATAHRSSSAAGQFQEPSSSTASAPMRQQTRRAPKAIPLDQTMELRNSDLARWSTDYLKNMAEAAKHKQALRAVFLARKNAEYWVLGMGLGNIGKGVYEGKNPGPLAMFSGYQLLETLTGVLQTSAGHKRDRDGEEEDVESDGSGRRVRMREDGEQAGRGDGDTLMMDDTRDMGIAGDDTIEMGRNAPTPLADASITMPWNASASVRGSSVRHGQFSAGGFSMSTGVGPSSIGGVAAEIGRRGSRMVSASPLMGRGRISGIEEDLGDYHGPGIEGDNGVMAGAGNNEFEIFGPGANVDTQTAGNTQWLRSALDTESTNFREFVVAGIEEADQRRLRHDVTNEEDLFGTVTFEALLPPDVNSCIVAAQGLLHVLTLATKNIVRCHQAENFGPITLHMIDNI